MVPAGLARPLAKLAITGAKTLSDRNGGLVRCPVSPRCSPSSLPSLAMDPSSVRSLAIRSATG